MEFIWSYHQDSIHHIYFLIASFEDKYESNKNMNKLLATYREDHSRWLKWRTYALLLITTMEGFEFSFSLCGHHIARISICNKYTRLDELEIKEKERSGNKCRRDRMLACCVNNVIKPIHTYGAIIGFATARAPYSPYYIRTHGPSPMIDMPLHRQLLAS